MPAFKTAWRPAWQPAWGGAWDIQRGNASPLLPTGFTANYDAQSLAFSDGAAITAWSSEEGIAGTIYGNPLMRRGANGINGHASVEFTADGLNFPLVTGLDKTIFVVAQILTTGGSFPTLVTNAAWTNADNGIRGNTTGVSIGVAGSAFGTVSQGRAMPSGGSLLFYSKYESSGTTFGIGATETTDAVDRRVAGSRIYVAHANTTNAPMNVKVGQVLVYPSALSALQISQVKAYLDWRWGLNDFGTYTSRIQSAGETWAPSEQAAYDALLTTCAPFWSKILECGHFPKGTSLAAAAVKMKVYTPSGSGSLINESFTTGGLIPGGGVEMTGTTAYWRTFSSGLTSVGGIGAFSIWTKGSESNINTVLIGKPQSGSPYRGLLASSDGAGKTRAAGAWGGTSPILVDGATRLGRGFYRLERPSLSSLKLRVNGAVVASSATTVASTLPDEPIRVAVAPAPVDFWAIDDGTLTDAESQSFGLAVTTYLNAIGQAPLESNPCNLVIWTGQSLAVGQGGSPVLTSTQPYKNKMAVGGVLYPIAATTHALTPLKENSVETSASGFANTVSMLRRNISAGNADQDTFIANYAIGGMGYSALKKGGTTSAYSDAINAVTAALDHAPYGYSGLLVRAVNVTHGETDQQSATYQTNIRQWQTDFETDIKAITGQSGVIPMIHSQPSAWTISNFTTALSAYAILAEARLNPTKTLLVCPKYFIPHNVDGLHLINTSYRLLGEYYAKAYDQHVVRGVQWSPLMPTSIVRSGAVITVSFAGRVGALVLDTTAVSDPGNYGFEVTGGGSISAVVIVGNTVEITVSGTTTRLRYAYTGVSGNSGGPTTGPRGCLRDSDTTVGQSGAALPNWCVHFDDPVT